MIPFLTITNTNINTKVIQLSPLEQRGKKDCIREIITYARLSAFVCNYCCITVIGQYLDTKIENMTVTLMPWRFCNDIPLIP